MHATRAIAVHEFKTAVARRSFWFMTFLFPVIILVLSFGNSFVGDLGGESLQEALERSTGQEAIGVVDQGGLIGGLPPDVPAELVRFLPSADAARAALDAGEIGGYYVVPADYVENGSLTVVETEYQPLSTVGDRPLVEYVLTYALTGDAEVAAAMVDPLPRVEVENVGAGSSAAAAEAAGDDTSASAIADLVPLVMVFVLFFVITTSSSYLLQSVTKEKENRTAEVLLVTVEPRQLMLGKVLGLAAVALLQITVWVGGGILAATQFADVPDLGGMGISTGLGLWMVGFLLLGYLAYGSVLAALGALVPSQREGTQLMFVVLLPLMVPLWFNYVLIEDPEGLPAVALSLFPLSAPVAMMARLASQEVPLWQPAVALAGLAATAYLFVILGARVFRADHLLASDALSLRAVGRALREAIG